MYVRVYIHVCMHVRYPRVCRRHTQAGLRGDTGCPEPPRFCSFEGSLINAELDFSLIYSPICRSRFLSRADFLDRARESPKSAARFQDVGHRYLSRARTSAERFGSREGSRVYANLQAIDSTLSVIDPSFETSPSYGGLNSRTPRIRYCVRARTQAPREACVGNRHRPGR